MTITQQFEPSAEAIQWLMDVAGVEEADIARYSAPAWAQWERAMYAKRKRYCPGLPEWAHPQATQWAWDFSMPYPTVAQLWPTQHDWFTEEQRHENFTLEVAVPADGHASTLDTLRIAWTYSSGV